MADSLAVWLLARYPPYWVKLPDLWEAMTKSDPVTGATRSPVAASGRNSRSVCISRGCLVAHGGRGWPVRREAEGVRRLEVAVDSDGERAVPGERACCGGRAAAG